MGNRAQPDPCDILRDRRATELLQPFLRLNFVTVWVGDQERSRRFFVDRLGFQVAVDAEVPGMGRWIVVAPQGHMTGSPGLALVVPPEGSPETERLGQNTGVSFLTEDVRAVFEEWSKHGVRFTLPPMEPSWGSGQARYALFEDVDGNSYSLIEFDEATRTLEAERRAAAEKLDAERRAAQEMAIAKEVQERLFPQRLPRLDSLEYAGLCLPAREVGGDYYDFLDFGHGRIGFVVGDVAGKGIAAALLMANLQANLRSQYALALDDLERLLESVNLLFYENTPEASYSTLFFAEYEDKSGRLRYANCGHLPPILLHRDKTLECLAATSTVLGIFNDWQFAMADVQLVPGDTLVLYTDGVTEARGADGGEFGEARLVELIRAHSDLPAAGLLQAIVNSVKEFSGGAQEDDITLVVARRA